MITKQDINELEERVTRMFPFIGVEAVNIISAEIKNLRALLDKEIIVSVETTVMEEKLVITKSKKNKAESTDKQAVTVPSTTTE